MNAKQWYQRRRSYSCKAAVTIYWQRIKFQFQSQFIRLPIQTLRFVGRFFNSLPLDLDRFSPQESGFFTSIAMAIDDDMMEGSVSSLILDSFEQSENVLSNDDLAWVDSCLIKDPEMHDEGWNSLKDALLEILSSKPELMYSSASRNDGSLGEIDMEILPSRMDADTAESPGGTYFDLGLTNEVESTSEDNPINKALRSQLFAGNAFLPNYVEGPQEGEDIGSGLDLGISAYELEQSSEDIFRVWDLVVLAEEEEEDELVKQLNKALTDNSFESIQSTQSDLEAWKKDLPSESIDDLIAGIADLSLIPYSA